LIEQNEQHTDFSKMKSYKNAFEYCSDIILVTITGTE